jgi:hypothetical protein
MQCKINTKCTKRLIPFLAVNTNIKQLTKIKYNDFYYLALCVLQLNYSKR